MVCKQFNNDKLFTNILNTINLYNENTICKHKDKRY